MDEYSQEHIQVCPRADRHAAAATAGFGFLRLSAALPGRIKAPRPDVAYSAGIVLVRQMANPPCIDAPLLVCLRASRNTKILAADDMTTTLCRRCGIT